MRKSLSSSVDILVTTTILLTQVGCDNEPNRRSASYRSSSSESSHYSSKKRQKSAPLNAQARRAGENVRRTVEDAYYKHVPKDVQKHVGSAAKVAGETGKAVDDFFKGIDLK